jgi:subtilisin family serine protease
MAALAWLVSQQGSYNIASANLSLGGGTYADQAACDSANAGQKAAIDSLRAAGVATVLAAGNSSVTTGISAPACISSAVAVGATDDSDVVASFSNSSPLLDLWAPGVSIYSSMPGAVYGTMSGTSMAAPHVAGAWAVLKQKAPSANVDQILLALTTSGIPVTDTRNAVTRARLRVDAALTALDSLFTPTPTQTQTATPTETLTPTPTATATLTPTPTETAPPPPTETASPTATSSGLLPGDLNLDSQVNVVDVQLGVNVFLGTETDEGIGARADVNADGLVNVVDVQQIVNTFLAG